MPKDEKIKNKFMDFLNIKNIEEDSVSLFLMDLILLIAPGILWIFYFSPELFKELDVLKLIIFSSSISSPFIIFNAIISEVIGKILINKTNERKEKIFYYFTIGIFITNLVFFSALVLSYTYDYSIKAAIIALFFIEGIYLARIITMPIEKIVLVKILSFIKFLKNSIKNRS